MRYYSTKNKNNPVSFEEAALAGLAPDGGLYVPEEIPSYPNAVRTSLGTMEYTEIAYETIRLWVDDDIPDPVLQDMVHSAYPFGSPLVKAGDRLVLELFHGPSAAFKDFGARFMARAFAYLRRGERKPLKVLVATSGDTGGAVADGFFGMEGISVTVLYPKDKVSLLQEKQIAGLGGNVSALAVEGSFDDCQHLVKKAFGDKDLKTRLVLSSANSINISRLIPQAVYYAAAAGRIFSCRYDHDGEATPRRSGFSAASGPMVSGNKDTPVFFCVPSGNFGNLTAGLYAWKMGAPILGFVAATNINKTVPDFLENGNYNVRPSRPTISNAMDVGAPSNFERMVAHFSWEDMRSLILGASVSDEETSRTITDVFNRYGYYLDPHSAVGWRAVDKLRETGALPKEEVLHAPVLATAHPAKFAEIVEPLVGTVPLPPSLIKVEERTVNAVTIPANFEALKENL